jgi:hypothetical protein
VTDITANTPERSLTIACNISSANRNFHGYNLLLSRRVPLCRTGLYSAPCAGLTKPPAVSSPSGNDPSRFSINHNLPLAFTVLLKGPAAPWRQGQALRAESGAV